VKTTLLKAVRIVERADTNSMRTVMFARYAEQHAVVRLVLLVYRVIRRTPAAPLMVGLYGVVAWLSFSRPVTRAPILALARFANARHQLESIIACLATDDVCWAPFSSRPSAWLANLPAFRQMLGRPRAARRYLRCVGAFCRRHDFYVSCRLASTVALYARARQILSCATPKAVLVSSDYNTEEVALTRAAKAHQIPSIYVAHAQTNRLSPPLDLELAILDGQAALDVYADRGAVSGRVVFRGVEGPSTTMAVDGMHAAAPVIGLFLPSQISWEVLRDIVASCRRRFGPCRFRVRWHPNMVEPHRLDLIASSHDDIDESPRGASLVDDARQCNFVIADESSNVHLTVLKTGIPTLAIAGLGIHPPDMADHYGFITHGVIPPLQASVDAIVMSEIAAFYGPAWAERFRYYDAGYMRPPSEIEAEIRQAIAETAGLSG
jgi:hypothetical protein